MCVEMVYSVLLLQLRGGAVGGGSNTERLFSFTDGKLLSVIT